MGIYSSKAPDGDSGHDQNRAQNLQPSKRLIEKNATAEQYDGEGRAHEGIGMAQRKFRNGVHPAQSGKEGGEKTG